MDLGGKVFAMIRMPAQLEIVLYESWVFPRNTTVIGGLLLLLLPSTLAELRLIAA